MNHFATRIRQAQLPTTASDRPKTYLQTQWESTQQQSTQKKYYQMWEMMTLYLQSHVIDIYNSRI